MRCAVGLIPEGLGGLDVSSGEQGTVFVGHSVKAECCLCTFFFFFFFSFFLFFLNHVIIDLGTKSCMQLALWHIKNLNSKN